MCEFPSCEVKKKKKKKVRSEVVTFCRVLLKGGFSKNTKYRGSLKFNENIGAFCKKKKKKKENKKEEENLII